MSELEQVELRTDLARRWQGSDVFDVVDDLNGESIREMAGRSTIRFEIDGDASAEDLKKVVEQSRARSAVFDCLTNPVAIDIEVTAS